MVLIGIGLLTTAALAADLRGSEETRPFTRRAWGVGALWQGGVTPGGIVSGFQDVAGILL